jgi:hypothetical protein
MNSRTRIVTIAVVLGFVLFLAWSTLSSQKAECTVTMEFEGRQATATASAASQPEALNQARSTACGPISSGMDDRIACDNRPPVTQRCRNL